MSSNVHLNYAHLWNKLYESSKAAFNGNLYCFHYTLPFKFIYYKDDQAHECRWHEHDDRSAAVATVTAVHERSFKGGKLKWALVETKCDLFSSEQPMGNIKNKKSHTRSLSAWLELRLSFAHLCSCRLTRRQPCGEHVHLQARSDGELDQILVQGAEQHLRKLQAEERTDSISCSRAPTFHSHQYFSHIHSSQQPELWIKSFCFLLKQVGDLHVTHAKPNLPQVKS